MKTASQSTVQGLASRLLVSQDRQARRTTGPVRSAWRLASLKHDGEHPNGNCEESSREEGGPGQKGSTGNQGCSAREEGGCTGQEGGCTGQESGCTGQESGIDEIGSDKEGCAQEGCAEAFFTEEGIYRSNTCGKDGVEPCRSLAVSDR